MRFNNLLTLGALGVATLVSGLQETNSRDMHKVVEGSSNFARDPFSADVHVDLEARGTTSKTSSSKTSTSKTSTSKTSTSKTSTDKTLTGKTSTGKTSTSSTSRTAPTCGKLGKRSRLLPRVLYTDTVKSKGMNSNDGSTWELAENEYKKGLSSDDTISAVDISGCSFVVFKSGAPISAFHILSGNEKTDGAQAAKLTGKADYAVVSASSSSKFELVKEAIKASTTSVTADNYGSANYANNEWWKLTLSGTSMSKQKYTCSASRQAQKA